MAAWSRTTLKFLKEFLRFFLKKNEPLLYNFQNSIAKVYMATPIDVVFEFRKMLPTGNRRNRALLTWQKRQHFSCLSNCRCCADHTQNRPGPSPNNVFRAHQISSKRVHFWRSYSRTHKHRFLFCRVNPIFARSSFEAYIKQIVSLISPSWLVFSISIPLRLRYRESLHTRCSSLCQVHIRLMSAAISHVGSMPRSNFLFTHN